MIVDSADFNSGKYITDILLLIFTDSVSSFKIIQAKIIF